MIRKILHVTGAMNVGGTETMLINLYKKINKNIEFHFISYSKLQAFYDEEIENLGGKVIRLNSPSDVGFITSIKDIKKVIDEDEDFVCIIKLMSSNVYGEEVIGVKVNDNGEDLII